MQTAGKDEQMIKIEHTEVYGWEAAIRGMRNPMNSWEKSDSHYCDIHETQEFICDFCDGCAAGFAVGAKDHALMMKLAKAGPVHAKYRRMITVTCDITAPLYWWKEFDTYKVGTVANSCSTMHKIADKEFELEDFSHEHLFGYDDLLRGNTVPMGVLDSIIFCLNKYRKMYLKSRDKLHWWQMIQLLPTSYNQRRTVLMNYEVLAHIYPDRREHKLDEWREFCQWIETLPYSELITCRDEKTSD